MGAPLTFQGHQERLKQTADPAAEPGRPPGTWPGEWQLVALNCSLSCQSLPASPPPPRVSVSFVDANRELAIK